MTVLTAMHPRERWLAAYDGLAVDRIPFWAKIGGTHRDRWMPGSSYDDLHEAYGSTPPDGVPACVTRTRPGWEVSRQEEDGWRRIVQRSPSGRELVLEEQCESISGSWHPVRFPCRSAEDVALLTDYADGVAIEPVTATRQAEIAAMAEERRRRTVVLGGVGISPLMEWIQHLAGVEEGHYLLADEPELVEALFAAKHRVLCRTVEIMASSGLYDAIIMTENTSTTLISVDQYERYCLPFLHAYATIAQAHGCRMQLHMCGHLKAVLPLLARLPVNSFEAFTAPPVGNTRLIDGRTACPEVCLIGGTSAALWLRPQEEIIAAVCEDLETLPHHRGIVVSSGGVMPPVTDPVVSRAVSQALGALTPRC